MLTASSQPAPTSPAGAALRPPVAPRLSFVRWALSPTVATVPQVRARLRAVLEGWRVTPDVADVLLLAVSELASNAVQHAGDVTERLRVAVTLDGGQLQLEVDDGDPSLLCAAPEVDPDAESGRGLMIVNLLVIEAGGALAVLPHDHGKTVRVRLPAL
ncbi:ATP-binding protein [Streptomyces sp. A3M-1-3]|uniref:ATP-binding protein n=1 Tax=Streptomyces sp. A3M-1-3 TaxID=2962044 RepID=UPI0020B72625|nr:ATP-binding protein [Streptomyces sp. A3M-1-3]MCP3818484.1 ATP-binding protein [Streptomyces sp. A3M-1-3]